MTDIVDHTLKLWRQTPFVYGQNDCLLSIADYAVLLGYKDVTQQFRGTYHDEEGARAVIAANGGQAALVDLIGMPRCDVEDIKRGDVVLWNTGDDLIGAICTGDGVAGRSKRTTFELAKRLVIIDTAWKV